MYKLHAASNFLADSKVRISARINSSGTPSSSAVSFAASKKDCIISTPVTFKPNKANSTLTLPGPQHASRILEPAESSAILQTASATPGASAQCCASNIIGPYSSQKFSFSNHSSAIFSTFSHKNDFNTEIK